MAYTPHSPQPRPPMKGAFPLDHEGECKELMQGYMACLKQHKHVATKCREWSQRYLEVGWSVALVVALD